MAALGMDDELLSSDWAWMCTMCQRCIYVCPMKIDIPQLVFQRARNEAPGPPSQGNPRLLRHGAAHDTCSAMGPSEEDWRFVVEDVAEEVRENQPGFEDLQAPMDKEGFRVLPEPELQGAGDRARRDGSALEDSHIVGADWTYGSKGWAAENYCMFLADNESWEHIVRTKVKAVEDLGCKVWLNTE
jgi:hypothetical protein